MFKLNMYPYLNIFSVHWVPLSGAKMRVSKLKIQKAYLVTKCKCMFQKSPFSKYKRLAKSYNAFGDKHPNSYNALSILLLEATVNFPNCLLCFTRQITLSVVLSFRTRSHLSTIVDTAKMNCVLILDENHGVIDQHNDEKIASNGGAEVGLDS